MHTIYSYKTEIKNEPSDDRDIIYKINNEVVRYDHIRNNELCVRYDIIKDNEIINIMKKSYENMAPSSLPIPKLYTHKIIKGPDDVLGVQTYIEDFPIISIDHRLPSVLRSGIINHEMAHYCKQHIKKYPLGRRSDIENNLLDCAGILGLIWVIITSSILVKLLGIIFVGGIICLRRFRQSSLVLILEEEAERLAIKTLLKSGDVESVGYKLTSGWMSLRDNMCEKISCDRKIKLGKNVKLTVINYKPISLYERWNRFISTALPYLNYLQWGVDECRSFGLKVFCLKETDKYDRSVCIFRSRTEGMIFGKHTRHDYSRNVWEWLDRNMDTELSRIVYK